MRSVKLPGAELAGAPPLSVLGFGCAALLGRASRRESERAVAAALDHGINFFDTARSYGYGESEGLLGRVLAGRRDQVVLCTKFGIVAATSGGWKQALKPLARAAVKLVPSLRKAAQRQAGTQFMGGQFTLENLRTSLETSLRELQTDYVDMLLLHAAPASVLESDDLMDALQRLVEQGKVRVAGISGELPVMERFFRERTATLKTAQFALNASTMEFVRETRANHDLLLVANHPFGGPGGGMAARIAALHQFLDPSLDPGTLGSLGEKLAQGGPDLLPEVVLNCILVGTGVAAVIPAMMQVAHLESNVRAVEQCRFSAPELEHLRTALIAQTARLAAAPAVRRDDRQVASSAPSS